MIAERRKDMEYNQLVADALCNVAGEGRVYSRISCASATHKFTAAGKKASDDKEYHQEH